MSLNDIEAQLIGNVANFSILGLLISLFVGLLLSVAIRWHFVKFGSTLSNREEFAQVFPFILLTTVLIISVVKSSLALSLGLVGALSIVRFRTPIKEPEELAYLFISIAAGLGLGANQILATVVSIFTILFFMVLINKRWRKSNQIGKKLFISVDIEGSMIADQKNMLEFTSNVMKKYTDSPDLRRCDMRAELIEILYLVTFKDEESLSKIIADIKHKHPSAGVTFLDQNNLPGI
jgi:hypothetical protein